MARRLRMALVFAMIGASATPARAAEESIARQEATKLLHEVPDATLTLADGGQVRLSTLWSEKPVLVTLFYQRCKGTCSPFLRSLKSAIGRVGGLGDSYRVVSVSFDPEDTAERVGELAKTLDIGRPGDWFVGVAPKSEVEALTRAIGFWYRQVPDTTQFDHPAMVAAVHKGRVVRVLLGNTVSVARFRELVMELEGTHVEFYTNPDAKTLFRCFEVDEATGDRRLGWGIVILLVPGAAAIAVGLLVFLTRGRAARSSRAHRRGPVGLAPLQREVRKPSAQ